MFPEKDFIHAVVDQLFPFRFNNCFGVLGILDRLHGTDAQFRKTMSFPRHRILTGLAPAREVYPEPVKKKS